MNRIRDSAWVTIGTLLILELILLLAMVHGLLRPDRLKWLVDFVEPYVPAIYIAERLTFFGHAASAYLALGFALLPLKLVLAFVGPFPRWLHRGHYSADSAKKFGYSSWGVAKWLSHDMAMHPSTPFQRGMAASRAQYTVRALLLAAFWLSLVAVVAVLGQPEFEDVTAGRKRHSWNRVLTRFFYSDPILFWSIWTFQFALHIAGIMYVAATFSNILTFRFERNAQ